ncbi:MAG: serine/threonine-protein kinase [Chthoniobacteraceae bacterium]
MSVAPSQRSDESHLIAGRSVFRRYTLRRLLGRGGMGVVWLAHDDKLDRPVALKFMHDAVRLDRAVRDDLKRETRRTLELTHPNIVRTYDFVEDEDLAAISLEYIDGPTLSEMRVERTQRCFEVDELAPWVQGLCRALDYAHREAATVHRDLKPANLMVTSRGILKVADFGIAAGLHHTAGRLAPEETTSGTLRYMSPQQLAGELPSPADDIYAMGVTLYELITSKPPFYAGDLSLQIRERMPEPMQERRLALGMAGHPIPVAWESTVRACLAKNPAERPASAGEIVARLGLRPGAMDETEVTHVGMPLPQAAAPDGGRHRPGFALEFWRPRKRWVLGAALISFVLLLGLGLRKSSPNRGAPDAPVAVETPPPAAASTPGGLIVRTVPGGALVAVGRSRGNISPVSMDDVPAGPQTVEISLAGYEPVTVQIQIHSKQLTDLGVITLVRSTGDLHVTADLENTAYVLVAESGEAPIRSGRTPENIPDLPTGRYRVRFIREGLPTIEKEVAVERAQTAVVEQRFDGLPAGVEIRAGFVKVESLPPGAEVFDHDEPLGQAPLEISLPSGKHVIMAKFAGRESRPREFTLAEGETKALRFDFTPAETSSKSTPRQRSNSRQPRTEEESLPRKVGRSLKKVFNGKNFHW